MVKKKGKKDIVTRFWYTLKNLDSICYGCLSFLATFAYIYTLWGVGKKNKSHWDLKYSNIIKKSQHVTRYQFVEKMKIFQYNYNSSNIITTCHKKPSFWEKMKNFNEICNNSNIV